MPAITITASGPSVTNFAAKHNVNDARGVTVDVPAALTSEDVQTITKDLEILLNTLKEKPSVLSDILAAGASGNYAKARHIGMENGLTEDQFVAAGGGYVGAVVVACAVLLYCSVAL